MQTSRRNAMKKVSVTVLLSQLPITARIHYGTAFVGPLTCDAKYEANGRPQVDFIDVTIGEVLQRIEAGEDLRDINIKSISF